MRRVFEMEDFPQDVQEAVRAGLSASERRPRPSAAIEAVWRIESARLIAGLARMVGDVGLAEDLAQDALVAAMETLAASRASRTTRAPG